MKTRHTNVEKRNREERLRYTKKMLAAAKEAEKKRELLKPKTR